MAWFIPDEPILGYLGIAGKWGKIWGYWAGFARPISPFSFLAPAIPGELYRD
jgi:hypothetical protein